jgi:hypothetical protein
MPTKRPARPIRPIRPTPSAVTGGGSKKLVVIAAIVVLAIIAALYWFLSRGPSGLDKQSSVDTTTAGRQAGVPTSETSSDVGIAMGKARLQLESSGDRDIVRVVIDRPAGTEDSDVVYRFEWTVNGKPAGSGSDSLSGFKRGDRVAVKITPLQDGKAGSSKVLDFLVQNTPPRVTAGQDMKLDGNTFSCQVKGVDQDGDTLSYALEDAPEGMTIDPQSGAIRWQLKESDYGERTIKVKVSDGKGGVANYNLKVDLQKPSPQKTAGDSAK